ncbi:hypothetical protein FSP39_006637 [Pinctada imbricata]|uniref:Major facilitator superfamily (MFS) profile domain-containing protein n=1 Tax=Pinctada imbricata TaxID=66713 RepID=A0AA88YHQ4_PINIB|nr:hypothetical protein FSP39_006637 [Pinctada imbricata]
MRIRCTKITRWNIYFNYFYTACFLMYSLMMGSIKTFGILYAELLNTFHGGAGNTASIGSTCIFIQSMLGPLANALSMRYSFRKVTFLGGIFMSLGFLISAFTENMQMLYFSYSFLIGLGYGLTYVPCTTILNFYFDKHRALANGIVFAGSGIGGFALPFLYRFLLDNYGLHGAMIVLSGVMLNCCISALLFRQPLELSQKISSNITAKDPDLKQSNHTSSSNSSGLCHKCLSLRNTLKVLFTFRWSLFKRPAFALITLAYALACTGYDSNFYIIPALVERKGFGPGAVALSMSIIGIFEVFARVFFGWFVDRKVLSAHILFFISISISGVSSLCVPFLHNLELMYCYSAIVGIFTGSLHTFLPTILVNTVGLDNLPAALGLLTVFLAVASGIGQPSLGWLTDLTGTWDASNFTVGAILLISAFIVLSVDRCMKNGGDKTEEKETVEIGMNPESPHEKDPMLMNGISKTEEMPV